MERLIEFATKHFYLVSAAVLMLAVVIVSEFRARLQAFAAISPGEAVRLMNQGALVLDVREPAKFQTGHIREARNIDPKNLPAEAESLKKHREKPLLLYCDTGMASGTVARGLVKLGFTKVVHLQGGLDAWRKENLPLVRTGER